jgi:signal transduction histidine kinase
MSSEFTLLNSHRFGRARMISSVFDKLKRINPWHFVWISIVSSELITLSLSSLQERLWWGHVSRETLIIGAVDSLVVPLIVATIVIYFVKQIAALDRSNSQLQEANRKLCAIDKMKTDIMSIVSHELRTPLTTIKAFIELIIMKPGMPEQRKKELICAINVEADRLSRMISEFLDLARIESGGMKWRFEEVCVEDIIMHSVTSMSPLIEGKSQCLTTAFHPKRTILSGDRDRLIQVVTNLLSNAVKYTSQGGSIHVAVRLDSDTEEHIVVEISDTGMGIPDEDIELIFEKFHRSGDHLTGAIEGSGLGLAIARQIVEYHGGRIWASSTRGRGSTFTFTLPTATAEGTPTVR